MSGVVYILGLPYNTKNTTYRHSGVNIGYDEKVNIGVGKTLNGYIPAGQANIILGYTSNDTVASGNLTEGMLSDGSGFVISGQYQV